MQTTRGVTVAGLRVIAAMAASAGVKTVDASAPPDGRAMTARRRARPVRLARVAAVGARVLIRRATR